MKVTTQPKLTSQNDGPATTPKPQVPTLVIRAGRPTWQALDLRTAWRQRELILFFTARDLKLRYKQTGLGVAWTLIQPLMTTGVFTLFFGKMVKVDSDGFPYPLFCFAALLFWNYFANSLARGSNSLVTNSNLINKIYFPRILIVIAALVPPLVDFGIGFVMFLLIAQYYGYFSLLALFSAIPLLLITFFAVLGLSLLLSALNVRYRDVSNVLPFVIQLGMFITPVIYPVSLVSHSLRWIYSLNPLVGIISGFRSAVLGTTWDIPSLTLAVGTTCVLVAAGLSVFLRLEKTFADAI